MALAPACLDELQEISEFLADVAGHVIYEVGLDTYEAFQQLPQGGAAPEVQVIAFENLGTVPFLALRMTGRFVEARLYDERYREHYDLLVTWLRERARQRLADKECQEFLKVNKEWLVHLVRRDDLVAYFKQAPATPAEPPARPWWERLVDLLVSLAAFVLQRKRSL